jgi:hypothetical protein
MLMLRVLRVLQVLRRQLQWLPLLWRPQAAHPPTLQLLTRRASP